MLPLEIGNYSHAGYERLNVVFYSNLHPPPWRKEEKQSEGNATDTPPPYRFFQKIKQKVHLQLHLSIQIYRFPFPTLA